jgi:hypothetical protein
MKIRMTAPEDIAGWGFDPNGCNVICPKRYLANVNQTWTHRPMDPIKGINQIAQILRQKMAERKSAQVQSGSGIDAATVGASVGKGSKASTDEVKRKIGERIRALPEEERKSPQAARIFVETVIAWEFGEQLLQDPQFTDLSTEVVNALAGNPAVWEKMQTLLGGLGR